ncbi:hypothetical protein RI367_003624 [Sorochytrium milnesiophthora]
MTRDVLATMIPASAASFLDRSVDALPHKPRELPPPVVVVAVTSRLSAADSAPATADVEDLQEGSIRSLWLPETPAGGNSAVIAPPASAFVAATAVPVSVSVVGQHRVSLAKRQLASDDDVLRLLPTFAPLASVTQLDLSRNRLPSLPMALASLSCLTTLNVAANALSEVPRCIFDLHQLQSLDLSRNGIAAPLPVGLARLIQLRRLRLDGNSFSGALPVEYAALTQLTSLTLGSTFGGNALSSLPHGLFPHLASLTEFDASHNDLHRLPDDILLAPSLRVLILAHNKLDTIPIPHDISAVQSRLRVLNLSNNLLCKLSTSIARLQLELLDLSGNSLCFVPQELLEVMRRQCVNVLLTGNPFTKVPVAQAAQIELSLTPAAASLQQQDSAAATSAAVMARYGAQKKGKRHGRHHHHKSRQRIIQYEEDGSPSSPAMALRQQQQRKLMSVEDLSSAMSSASSSVYDLSTQDPTAKGNSDNDDDNGPEDAIVHPRPLRASLSGLRLEDDDNDDHADEPSLLSAPPTLVELCARTIHNNNISYSAKSLPPMLFTYLSEHAHAAPCLCCASRFAQQWVSVVAVENVAGHHLLPVRKRFCSLKCVMNGLAQRTQTLASCSPARQLQPSSSRSLDNLVPPPPPSIIRSSSSSKMWIVDPDELEDDDRVSIHW